MNKLLSKMLIVAASVLLLMPGCADDESGETSDENTSAVYEGYTLFAPMNSTTTYLIDINGTVVHSWESNYRPGLSVYLLENGNLLRTANLSDEASSNFMNNGKSTGGTGGRIEELDWDGNIVWEWEYSSDEYLHHHDIEYMENGNILLIAWEYKKEEEVTAAGCNTSLFNTGYLWPDHILEIERTGTNQAAILWEWHAWDHLTQDYDPGKDNYQTDVDRYPERIDLNYTANGSTDWNHTNAVDYNEESDQILLSVHSFGEIWIIDHSTTSAEAAGHTGGTCGKGGDLLFRWGNPQTYGSGSASDQVLYGQHDAQWIPDGYPGEGNILIFNNGSGRSPSYSNILEITPTMNADNSYYQNETTPYEAEETWDYTPETPTDFYAKNISGAQRLPNGNTLICSGPDGYLFEVTSEGETVWEYDYDGSIFRATRYAEDYAGLAGLGE
ncbi:MAG: arylsulfotransferase [bacterium]|nr:arylsulfotransferase [bacterium]